MMTRINNPKRLALGLSLVLGLSACGGGGSGGLDGIFSLGSDFVAAFNQRPTDTPVDAQSVNLVLTPTQEPFNPR